MLATASLNGNLGWTVVSDGPFADGSMRWKWSAFTPAAGAWGFEASQEQAIVRAKEEFDRLGGDA